MQKKILLLILCLTAFTAGAQKGDEAAIRALLQQQVTDWNTGSIERYMTGYWNSDSLVFIGRNGPKYGYAGTLANYLKSYPDTAAMGRLSFEVISLKKLSPDYYFAIGRWALARSAGDVSGAWTLLFRRIHGHWKIVVDHSS